LKYLTREWQDGALTDEASELVLDRYRDHLESIRPRLPPTLLALVDDVGISDGIIHVVQHHYVSRVLHLWMCSGDSEKGYSLVHIGYHDVAIDGLPSAKSAIEESEEIILGEVDIASDGTLIQRFLLYPDGELWIEFRNVTFTLTPLPCRTTPAAPVYFEQLSS
jgi:hypothetical protein